MTLLRLRRAHHAQYLTHMLEVEQQVTRTAACRAGELLVRMLTDRPQSEALPTFPG